MVQYIVRIASLPLTFYPDNLQLKHDYLMDVAHPIIFISKS